MFAASTVLAGVATTINGTVHIENDKLARFKPNYDTKATIYFRRLSACVFVEVIESPVRDEAAYHMVDFSKLNGRWLESGDQIAFLSNKISYCFHNAGNEGCWPDRTLVPYSLQHARLIDDVLFVLRHGCGMGTDPDPY